MNQNRAFDLTNPQKNIWNMEQFFNDTTISNIPANIIFHEPVNGKVLEQAINNIIKKNDSFRIQLTLENGIPKQIISSYKSFDINISHIKESQLDDIRKEVISHKFEILESPLFYFRIAIFENGFGALIFSVHHLIADSWSLGLFAKTVLQEYHAALKHEILPESNTSYIDYINAELEYINSKKFEADKNYWDKVFDTIPEQLTISTKNQNYTNFSCDAKRKSFELDINLVRQINSYCSKNKLSVYNFFMSVYSLYLSRISRLDDFVIGTPILNRLNYKEKQTMGMFVNTLPIRINIQNNLAFTDFAHSLSTNMISVLKHERYSYQRILEDLRKKDSQISNLYNIAISYQITKAFDKEYGDYETDWFFNNFSGNDLTIHITDINDTGKLKISYDYLINKCELDDVKKMHERIVHIIEQLLNSEKKLIKNIEIVTEKEKNIILNEFNNTKVDYPKNKTIIDLFEEQAENNPENTAVIFEDQKITYKELNEKANSLANFLRHKEITSTDVVAIQLERSLDLIISIFAVIKSGSSYVLIDTNFPEERIKYIINDSNAKYCIINNNTKIRNIENTINLDNNDFSIYDTENPNISYSNNLCIIYTSGSTGNPKGVLLHKEGFINLVNSCNIKMGIANFNNILCIATVSFDMFAFELFNTLLFGNTLILANEEEQKNPFSMSNLIKKYNIDFLVTTPSKIKLLLIDELQNCLNTIKSILLGGERFNSDLYDQLRSKTKALIYNGYGPTEITACCSIKNITSNDITIGKPIANTQIYICDSNLNLLPIGVTGEICVGGNGVANGYLNSPEITLKNFVNNPFHKGKLYKTGDLGRYLENGEIEYINRLDNQVKIRGLRIELGEIEDKISKIPSIISCAVIKKENANNHEFLCAYFIAKTHIDSAYIRYRLEKDLPKYMIPAYFIQMDQLPYTISGKLDRKKLPDPNYQKNSFEFELPRNETDSKLINILKELLTVDKISISDSFFDLGGDSLLAINLCIKIKDIFNTAILVKDIMENPVIKDISDLINKNTYSSQFVPIQHISEAKSYPISSAQKRIFFANGVAGGSSIIYNTPGGIILDNILDTKLLEDCIKTLIQRHESLRTYFVFEDGTIVQKISKFINFKLDVLKNVEFDELDSVFNIFAKPFDLSKAPLFRIKYIEFTNKKSALLLDIHHIISDGTSMSIFTNELCKLYNGESLPDLKFTYKDFSNYEAENLKLDNFKEAENFWVHQFEKEIPILNMPTNQQRPAVQSFDGNKIYLKLNKETVCKINLLSKELEITPYMILLATYYILLSKYTSQEDIVIGSPIIGRYLPETYNIIGMFVNTLALRNTVDSSKTFKEFVMSLKENLLNCYQYQTYPFDELVNKLNIKRDTSRNPLFDTMFVYQNNGYAGFSFNGISTEYYIPNTNISKFDLSLEAVPLNDGTISLSFEYCTKLFNENFICDLSDHYSNILNIILNNKNTYISDISMLSDIEKDQIIYKFNKTTINYPNDKNILELFENNAIINPNSVAVIFEDKKITYKELNDRANKLSHYLVEKNVTKNDVIAILLNRSIELIVSIYAVIKSGASYVLIDNDFPEERINYIINDSNAKFCLKNSSNHIKLVNSIDIDKLNLSKYSNKNLNIELDNNLCIIYTSGSTGNPKGVVLHKSGFLNLIYAIDDKMHISKFSNILGIATVSFDMFAFELFHSISFGNTLILANEEEQKNPIAMSNLIKRYEVDFIVTTPSRIELLLLEECNNPLKNVKAILLGGEKFTSNLYNRLKTATNSKLYNGYGPTEITACCSIKEILSDDITIGTPLQNTEIYICDQNLNLLPVGVIGEICIGGNRSSKWLFK